MERAEELNLSGEVAATYAKNTVRVATEGGEEAKVAPVAPGKVSAVTVLLQLAVLAGVAAGALVIGQNLDRLRDGQANQVSETRAHNEQLKLLMGETAALKAEVVNLRHSVSSGSGEDAIFLKTMILKRDIDPDLARRIAGAIHRNTMLFKKDPNLVLAIISAESDFNPNAVSSVGAEGLMQVMPHWKKVLAIQGDLKDPDISVRYGLQVLGFYEEMYGDMETALTAYNRGPGPVDTALMRGKNPVKNNYAPKILETYERLKKLNVQAAGS